MMGDYNEWLRRKPEDLTIVGFAGGCMEYRLHVPQVAPVRVEEWALTDTPENMVKTGEVEFTSTAEAWAWIGFQLNIVKAHPRK